MIIEFLAISLYTVVTFTLGIWLGFRFLRAAQTGDKLIPTLQLTLPTLKKARKSMVSNIGDPAPIPKEQKQISKLVNEMTNEYR
jgi:hypothetical protein